MEGKNKKGLINEIYIVIILFIVIVVLICGFWIVATAGPLIVGEGKYLTETIQDAAGSTEPDGALDNSTEVSVGVANSFLGVVEFIIYAFFLGFLIGFVALCYYVRTYKWLAMVWVCLIIAAVFISFIISNAYQQASTSSTDLAEYYNTWGTSSFLMVNLPYIVAVFGVISGIVLFSIISTDSEEQTKEIL